jgi:hypothetical protein
MAAWIFFLLLTQLYSLKHEDLLHELAKGEVHSLITKDDLQDLKKEQDDEFIEALKNFYKPDTEAIIGVDDLEFLISKGILDRAQALIMWEALLRRAEEDSHHKLSNSGFHRDSDHMILGMISVLSIFYGLGSYVIVTLFGVLAVSYYKQQASLSLFVISSFFATLFYAGGVSLHVGHGSGLISACLLLCCCIAVLISFHMILVFVNLADMQVTEEDVLPFHGFRQKFLCCIVAIGVSYMLSLQCDFPLVQLPFFVAITYIITMIGLKLHSRMPLFLQPFWIFGLFAYAIGVMIYIHYTGKEAFILETVKDLATARLDFRLMAYLTSLTIISWTLPIIAYVNYLQEHEAFRKEVLCLPLLQSKWHEWSERSIAESNTWKLKDIWVVGYVLFQAGLVFYGFYIKMWAMVLVGHFCLALGLLVLPKTYNIFPDKILYPALYFIVLITPATLSHLDDHFSYHATAYFNESWLWNCFLVIVRLISTIVGLFSLSSCHLLATKEPKRPEDMKDMELLYDTNGIENISDFFIRYVLCLILLRLAETEDSSIISVIYSLVGLLIYYQAIIYTTVTRTDAEKLIITAVVFLSGMRISLLAQNIFLTFYLGIGMMLMAIYRTYQVAYMNAALYFATFAYCMLLILHSFCLKSSSVLVLSILVLFVLLSKEINSNRWKLLTFFMIVCSLIFMRSSGLDIGELFSIVEKEAYRHEGLGQFYLVMADPTRLVPEKKLFEDALNWVQNSLLGVMS